jgi:hypothetical protein
MNEHPANSRRASSHMAKNTKDPALLKKLKEKHEIIIK